MINRIPEVVAPALESYFAQINHRLPGFLEAFYIVGSIALDEFNPHFSDVDFIAVTNHPATEQESKALYEIHQKVESTYPHWKLSGAYLLASDLGKQSREIGERVVFHDGKLDLQSDFEANPVTWWILKNYGVPALGVDPSGLSIPVDENYLVTWTLGNMNTYWKSWTQQPGKLISMLSDWGIQWTVLGVARQFYTIMEKKVITKKRSGEYALTVFPAQYHRILREAIRLRTKSDGALYRSRLARMREAVKFMKYVFQVSSEHVRKLQAKGAG
ncbi:MAG: DUF4111 domain-containing protein [Anaerolineales bacterium]